MNRLRGLTRGRLCRKLGLPDKKLQHLAHTAGNRYQEIFLGEGRKARRLMVPDSRLKRFQRRFYREFLRDFPYHEAVYCCAGRGAIEAARVHRRHPYLLHLDISGFFPSVDCGQVRACLENLGVDPDFVKTLTRLLTVNNELPQGAPTSVALGNLVLFPLDRRLQGQCDASGAGFAYTRYVDDIAISGGSRLTRFMGSITGIIEDCGWDLNEKGGLLGPDEDHQLLGLRVGVEVSVDEQFLADVETALADLLDESRQLPPSILANLRGQIAWIKAVEPEKGSSLEDEFHRYMAAADDAA